jgi:hypothetical protein
MNTMMIAVDMAAACFLLDGLPGRWQDARLAGAHQRETSPGLAAVSDRCAHKIITRLGALTVIGNR